MLIRLLKISFSFIFLRFLAFLPQGQLIGQEDLPLSYYGKENTSSSMTRRMEEKEDYLTQEWLFIEEDLLIEKLNPLFVKETSALKEFSNSFILSNIFPEEDEDSLKKRYLEDGLASMNQKISTALGEKPHLQLMKDTGILQIIKNSALISLFKKYEKLKKIKDSSEMYLCHEGRRHTPPTPQQIYPFINIENAESRLVDFTVWKEALEKQKQGLEEKLGYCILPSTLSIESKGSSSTLLKAEED